MKIQENISLKQLNTFGMDVSARYYGELTSLADLKQYLADADLNKLPLLLLGGGSNMLFTDDFNGVVLRNGIKGINLEREDSDNFFIKAGAGESWHNFVVYCVEKSYNGVENLSLIPGSVGAAPIQNIGAYGVELRDVFYNLEAINLKTGEKRFFNNKDCKFAYRDSIFKKEYKGEYVICYVTFMLKKQPNFNISYGGLKAELDALHITELNAKLVSDAVCSIRRSKLPDPAVIGNAGSFFKNPIVSLSQFQSLQQLFPEMVSFKHTSAEVKLAAAWLIEQCGWKGKRFGDAGVHEKHALVLTNYGSAKGKDIYVLSEKIKRSVEDKFGVALEREINVV